MRRWILALVLLASIGCAPQGHRVDVRIRNVSPYPIRLRLTAGPFARTVDLAPGSIFDGWIDTRWNARDVQITIE